MPSTSQTRQEAPDLMAQARLLLPQATIAYQGQEGRAHRLTVTVNGERHVLVYREEAPHWQCDCQAFAQGTCLHTALVQAWREEQPAGNGAGLTPPTSRSGRSGPKRPGRRTRRSSRASQGEAPASALPTPAQGVQGWSRALAQALLAPFPPEMVGWKAQSVSKDGKRALAVAYVDARAVMDRLDATVGPAQWSDRYTLLREQSGGFGPELVVACRLTVLGVTKTDVGVGEDAKAAYSDAFKRAAVKFGIARYLYSLPKAWVDYDAKKRQLLGAPPLPAWARPRG